MSITASSGAITSTGIGSGLDVESIITKLMAIEQRPLNSLQADASEIQTKISAYGQMQSAETSFRDAAQALASATTWSATTGTSSDAVSVGVATGPGATAGSYTVTVQNLALAQSVATGAFANSGVAVGSGTLHIDTGSWATGQTAFTAKPGSTGFDIEVTNTDTLASVRDKINAAGAGVTASIVNDASGARLVVSSASTGAANGFRISAVDGDGNPTDGAGLSALAYDPPGGTGTATTLTQAAANATATVNGLSISSASNLLSDVVQGLTLNLTRVSASPIQITVAQDTASIKTSIQAFVTAYNNLASMLGKATKYDPDTKTAGTLQADSAAVSLQRQLRNMVTASTSASSVLSTLSQAGIELQRDGTLKVNDAKLSAAMAKPAELQKLLSNNDVAGQGAADGIATRLKKFGDAVLGTGGLLTNRSAGLQTSLTNNTKRQDQLSDRLAATEARLRAQYTALDSKMATLNNLSNYMIQQITNWNKDTSND